MPPIIQLILILAVGYLSTHFIIGKLQSRFFFVSGLEYIILGVLIGPSLTHIMEPEVVKQLSPVMSLAMGSLALLYGLRLRFQQLSEVKVESYRVGFLEGLATFLFVGAVFGAVFWFGPLATNDWLAASSAALALASTAAVSAPTAIYAVRLHYKAAGNTTDLVESVVAFDQLLGIVLFGLIFCILHVGQTSGIRPLTTTEWVSVNLAFGIVLGILFFLFLGREQSEEKLLLALMGIVVFASGAAYYLNLSPLFINLILGIILANTSKIRDRLLRILLSVEKPLYVVLLIFAGAAWDWRIGPHPASLAWLVPAYVLLRYAGKLMGGYAAFSSSERPEVLARNIGAGFLPQGGVAVAMAINYQQVYQNPYTNLVVTCVLFSVIFYEFVSPRLTRNLLVDANEIEAERLEGGVSAASAV